MRKITKLLIPAILVVAMIVSCSVMFASAASSKTIYISATGTGTGTQTDPMGPGTVTDTVKNGAGSETFQTFTNAAYADVISWMKANVANGKMVFTNNALAKAHPLYRAIEALGAEGGTIVVVGDLAIDAADAFEKSYAGDFKLPESGDITITGGKLVLDHSTWNSTALWFGGNTTLKDIAVEYRYNSTQMTQYYEQGFSFYANGKNLTIDTGVTVTSKDYSGSTPVDGDVFPNLFTTTRNGIEQTCNPVLTVKSGTWHLVSAAGHSVSSAKNSSVVGNSTLNIAGGKIEFLNCAGVSPYSNRVYSEVRGDVAVNVTGGTIDTISCVTGSGITGKLTISLDAPAKVDTIVYLDTTKHQPSEPTSKAISYKAGTIDLANIDEAFVAAEITEKTVTPQTGSSIAIFSAAAVVALAGASVVISKKRARIED
ncbi:MAG: hypothetical protein E7593_02125 [Ruminococcaceae bacterium]|nr:hypothetical protein [Oscillospiraceae bacterium]